MAGLWQMVFRQLQPRKKRMVPQNVRLLNRNKPEESGQMHTQEQERTQKDVENEDLLINQIDEFREKAKQLQVLLEAKESKAAELQSLVDERAGKAQELEHILTERQEEADKIVTEFGRKVDALADKVTTKMAEIEAGLSGQAIANKKLSEGQIAEVKELLENATSQLESIKTDLSEKVHTENVKCYRNIQDLFNEFDSKIEKMDEMEGGVDSVKGYVKLLSWFSILNFVVLIIFILYSMGVFHF